MTELIIEDKKDKRMGKLFIELFNLLNKYFYDNELRLDDFMFTKYGFDKKFYGHYSIGKNNRVLIFINNRYKPNKYSWNSFDNFVHELTHLIQHQVYMKFSTNDKIIHSIKSGFIEIENVIHEQLINIYEQLLRKKYEDLF